MEIAREWLQPASSICVLTGAGISAESGIPTFRGPGGMWRELRPEDLATPGAFERDPKLVWEWYDWRRGLIAASKPNRGHYAIADLERRKSKVTVVTQNVDELHRRAGSVQVIELHGSIWTLRCTVCHREEQDYRAPLPELPPLCACGGLLRPGVVWFGEGLHPFVWDNAQQVVCSSEVLVVAGTSAVVYPAASLIPLAKRAGARVIEVNPEETPVSASVDRSLRGTSGEILPNLFA